METTANDKPIAAQAGASGGDAPKAGRGSLAAWLRFDNKLLLYSVIILILLLNIWLRTGLLVFQGFFEPDAFFYYTAIQQAVANHFVVAQTVTLSGFPWHNGFNEAPGLPYFTLVPYFFLQFVGMSVYDVMRLVPMLAGILIAIGAYFLAKYLSKSRALGLLAMFFVSASSGNIARTAGTIYRGDTFIALFVLVALIFLAKAMQTDSRKRLYIYLGIATFSASVGNVFWNGGTFVFATYILAALLIALYGFLAADRRILNRSVLVIAGIFFAYLLNLLYLYIHIANPSVVTTGVAFLILYVPLLIGVLLARFIITSKMGGAISGRFITRLGLVVIVGIVLFSVVYALFSTTLVYLLTNGGSVSPVGNIAATTQELQKPSFDFLVSSFGWQILLAPLGLIIFLLLAHRTTGDARSLMVGRLHINANVGFIVVFSYLLFTAYLQYGAIRYNALLSVPLAIFSAYAVYAVAKIMIEEGYALRFGDKFTLRLAYVVLGLITAIVVIQVGLTAAQSAESIQADGINSAFLQAMTWLGQNTPTNATVLALWPDGSVVEGWGNRTSFMDSVGGENGTRIVEFANFLGNTSTDTYYLYNQAHMPQYLVARNFWLQELGGLLAEGNSTELQNLTGYGYAPLENYQSGGNESNQIYVFINAQYRIELLLKTLPNGTKSAGAVIGQLNSSDVYQIKQVIFLNSSSGNYTVAENDSANVLNYTLFVSFSGTTIEGGTLLDSKLPESNIFKILLECGEYQCAYDNSNVTLTLVYQNSDTKIFKINYLNPQAGTPGSGG